jgi:hypothetical protein
MSGMKMTTVRQAASARGAQQDVAHDWRSNATAASLMNALIEQQRAIGQLSQAKAELLPITLRRWFRGGNPLYGVLSSPPPS